MRFAPLDFFAARYAGESLQVRKKSRILASIGLAFLAMSFVFGLIMAATGAMVVTFVFAGLALFCAAVLALLRSGRYSLAASIFLYGVFAAMFVAIKFDQYVDVYETYVFGTLGCFLLVVATLIADRPRQAIVVGLLDLAAIQALYWLDSYPAEGEVTTLAVQNLATASLMVILGAAVASYLVGFAGGLLREVGRKAEEAERSYAELNQAMGRAQSSSQRIGESLSASVERTSLSIEELSSRVEGIARGMDELDGALGRSGEANQRAEAGQGEVRSALAAYSDQVARASAAIEEMAATAASLAAQAAGKQAAVRGLVESARRGELSIAAVGQAMGEIQDSTRRVAELGAIIGDVADRTNLLGMNASIEAAHAGLAGRGFAVVANEIRNLSIEAAKSARVIADTLSASQSAISSTAERSAEALASFKRIGEDIRGVSSMIEELLASIRELSSGSEEVVASVEAVADLTRSTEAVVERSREGMGESLAGMDAVAEIASRVRTDTADMSARFDEMRRDSADVRRLGGENLGTIQALRGSLAAFAGPAGEPAAAARAGEPA
ncbi:MAG TPA: methyl-accepting chemotaxis protein [Spirochaetales bacterium]|nr:methyl-accepting chemotaxis protein [Spirochaetales bacterium]